MGALGPEGKQEGAQQASHLQVILTWNDALGTDGQFMASCISESHQDDTPRSLSTALFGHIS